MEVLDKFTKYVTELQTELQMRTKQYEYYRDMLLSENYLNNKLLEISENIALKLEWVKVGEVFKRLKGTPITATKMKEIENESGDIRVFAGGKTVINAFEKDIENANITKVPAVLVQSRGLIDVIYYDKPFTFKNEMWAYTSENSIEIKFLYYYLKNNIKKFRDIASSTGSFPQISIGDTENFKIPIVPLYLQEKVVDILDKFSEFVNETNGLLPEEIKERQKQYEYFREKLLSFDSLISVGGGQATLGNYLLIIKEACDYLGIECNFVEWKTLGEIGKFVNGTGMPKTMFDENGKIGAIHYGHIYTKYGQFVYEPLVRVSEENSEKLKKVSKGDLVIAKTSENVEDVMKTVAYLGDDFVVTGGHSAIFKHNQNSKFLTYTFNGSRNFIKQKNKLARGVKVIEISSTEMEKVKIPVPPLFVQEYVVDILDKFDTLVNDIKNGLPKEIELRQREYEFYREKLLSFDRESLGVIGDVNFK